MDSRICLYGPDGSGKSTLASLLAYYLQSNGFYARVSWLRGTHTLASIIARFLSIFPSFKGLDNPYYGISIPRRMLRLWWMLEFISMLPIWLLKYLLPSAYEIVIGERGLLDFLVWVSMTTNSKYIRSFWGRATLALALRYCRNIYIIANFTTLIKRRGNEAAGKLLPRQWIIYNVLHKYLGNPSVDTTSKSHAEALSQLITYLNTNQG